MSMPVEQAIFEYRPLGVESFDAIEHERRETLQSAARKFIDAQKELERQIATNLHRDLYGTLSHDAAEMIYRAHPTVEEGRKHIPGTPSDSEYQQQKRKIVAGILEQLEQLSALAAAQMLLRTDYQQIRAALLQLLFRQFGCHLDVELFVATFEKLRLLNMIPPDLTYEQVAGLCPIARWF